MGEKWRGPAGFGPVDIQGLKAAVVAATDVVFGRGGESDLLLDLYRPAGIEGCVLPTAVFIHGGGWTGGEKEMHRDDAARVAAHGYLAASINYRKSEEAAFPAALEDCKCAVRWLRAHAGECCADPDRIGLVGGSAGAHLAAMVALTPGQFEGGGGWDAFSSAVRCAACYCGPFDLTAEYIPDVVAVVDQFVRPAGPEDRRAARLRASPMAYVAPGAPPFLLVHGERDDVVPIEESERFASALSEAGVPVEFIPVRHANHGFGPVDAPATEPDALAIFVALVDFLDRRLKGAAPRE
jgi:acetyl esterase/lipase